MRVVRLRPAVVGRPLRWNSLLLKQNVPQYPEAFARFVLHLLGTQDDLALQAYSSYRGENTPEVNEVMLRTHFNLRNWDVFWEYFRKSVSTSPSTFAYNLAIRAALMPEAKAPMKIPDLVAELTAKGLKRNVVTLNLELYWQLCQEQINTAEVEKLHTHIFAGNECTPNLLTVRLFVWYYASIGDVDRVLEVYRCALRHDLGGTSLAAEVERYIASRKRFAPSVEVFKAVIRHDIKSDVAAIKAMLPVANHSTDVHTTREFFEICASQGLALPSLENTLMNRGEPAKALEALHFCRYEPWDSFTAVVMEGISHKIAFGFAGRAAQIDAAKEIVQRLPPFAPVQRAFIGGCTVIGVSLAIEEVDFCAFLGPLPLVDVFEQILLFAALTDQGSLALQLVPGAMEARGVTATPEICLHLTKLATSRLDLEAALRWVPSLPATSEGARVLAQVVRVAAVNRDITIVLDLLGKLHELNGVSPVLLTYCASRLHAQDVDPRPVLEWAAATLGLSPEQVFAESRDELEIFSEVEVPPASQFQLPPLRKTL
eukprot:TRINITY_DN10629_c0_g1_i1.p2 TRINITY_DN10629_c0_g1~~TRINITY_DN10629_c0_g1_i1.p2  ORF type:complete len:543 (+),score=94.74 TRINITY_DN10629_c0_g1_i1:30-1658(+)